MLMQEGETNRVRIGSKILISGPDSEPKFADVGVKFDCKLNERNDYIAVEGKLELNDLVSPATVPPTIRTFQAEIETAAPLDKVLICSRHTSKTNGNTATQGAPGRAGTATFSGPRPRRRAAPRRRPASRARRSAPPPPAGW